MKVTQADMDSRKRMANLRSHLTDVIGNHADEGITQVELLIVLADLTAVWARYQLRDELNEEKGAEGTDDNEI